MVFQQSFMYFFVSDTTGLITDLKVSPVSYIPLWPVAVVADFSFATPTSGTTTDLKYPGTSLLGFATVQYPKVMPRICSNDGVGPVRF